MAIVRFAQLLTRSDSLRSLSVRPPIWLLPHPFITLSINAKQAKELTTGNNLKRKGNIDMTNKDQNQKQAPESSTGNVGKGDNINNQGGDWYVNASVEQRLALIAQSAAKRGWEVIKNAIRKDGYVGFFKVDGRYFEIHESGFLIFDIDVRGFNPVTVEKIVDAIEAKIIEVSTPKQYDVYLTRDTSEEITVRVMAFTPAHALEVAKDEAVNNDTLEWSQTDWTGDVRSHTVNLVDIAQHGQESSSEVFNAGNEPETNIDIVTSIMEFSNYGALSQFFVLDAIRKFAKRVIESTPEELEAMKDGFITPQAWQGVAKEIDAKLDAFYKTKK